MVAWKPGHSCCAGPREFLIASTFCRKRASDPWCGSKHFRQSAALAPPRAHAEPGQYSACGIITRQSRLPVITIQREPRASGECKSKFPEEVRMLVMAAACCLAAQEACRACLDLTESQKSQSQVIWDAWKTARPRGGAGKPRHWRKREGHRYGKVRQLADLTDSGPSW